MDQACTHIQSKEYICKEAHKSFTTEESPCAVQLLTYKAEVKTCRPLRVQLHTILITKISDGQWLITAPKKEVAMIDCQETKDNIPIHGTLLLKSAPGCIVHIQSLTFVTTKPSKLNFVDVHPPVINLALNVGNQSQEVDPPSLDLRSISLKGNQEILTKLQVQKENLENIGSPVYYSRTSIWTVLLYLSLGSILGFWILRKICAFYHQRSQWPREVEIVVWCPETTSLRDAFPSRGGGVTFLHNAT